MVLKKLNMFRTKKVASHKLLQQSPVTEIHCNVLVEKSSYMCLICLKVHVSTTTYLRNRSALAVDCCVVIHCLEVICKEDQITSVQRE